MAGASGENLPCQGVFRWPGHCGTMLVRCACRMVVWATAEMVLWCQGQAQA